MKLWFIHVYKLLSNAQGERFAEKSIFLSQKVQIFLLKNIH